MRIIVFAGSGSSAPSGIPTFRGNLWSTYDVQQICNLDVFQKASAEDRQIINRFYADFAKMESKCQPHRFHRWLKEKQDQGHEVQIVTTNIDSLFERAGIANVFHVHGTLDQQRCIGCGNTWSTDWEHIKSQNFLDRCPKCKCRKTKPNVIFYGEKCVREYAEGNRILRKWCAGRPNNTMLLDVGSSHLVYQYATRILQKAGCWKVLINPDPSVQCHHHQKYNGDDWDDITTCLDNTIASMSN